MNTFSSFLQTMLRKIYFKFDSLTNTSISLLNFISNKQKDSYLHECNCNITIYTVDTMQLVKAAVKKKENTKTEHLFNSTNNIHPHSWVVFFSKNKKPPIFQIIYIYIEYNSVDLKIRKKSYVLLNRLFSMLVYQIFKFISSIFYFYLQLPRLIFYPVAII